MKNTYIKYILIFVLIGIFHISGKSLTPSRGNNTQRSYFGIRTSFDLIVPGEFKCSNAASDITFRERPLTPGPGLSIGVAYNTPVIGNLFLEPSVELYYNTTGLNDQELKIGENVESEGKFNTLSTRRFGTRIPITLRYKFQFQGARSVSIFTGPVLEVGFSNDYHISMICRNNVSFKKSGSLFNGFFNQYLGVKMQRVGLGLRAGIGFDFGKNYYFGLSGDIGLINMLKIPDHAKKTLKISYHENRFMISVGYNFR